MLSPASPALRGFEMTAFEAIADVSYPGLEFLLVKKESSTFLQVSCPEGKCNVTGAPLPWKGRKWYLSASCTGSEVVQTAFKAVLTALEHEARESFHYKGVPVCDPHLDLENLVIQRDERT